MKKQTLDEILEEIEEPRRGNAIKHILKDILMIGILSIVCTADTFTGMEIFAQIHEKVLREFLELPYGIPSHDTFGDVFSTLDSKQLSGCFEKWICQLRNDINAAELVSIDGKTIRGSKSLGNRATHVVTAFASELKLVLGQLAIDKKSNEITAIPELLKRFGVKGRIITIDAMGTQTQIAETIVHEGGDYVLALKNNQKMLYEDVSYYLEQEILPQKKSELKKAGLYAKSTEKGHGRIETRECYLCDNISWLEQRKDWASMAGAGWIASMKMNG